MSTPSSTYQRQMKQIADALAIDGTELIYGISPNGRHLIGIHKPLPPKQMIEIHPIVNLGHPKYTPRAAE